MPRRLFEIPLPASEKTVIITVELPRGTQVIKFGFKAEKAAIQSPGPNGATVHITPLMLCVGDRTLPREKRQFFMVTAQEDIPDDARFIDLIALPNNMVVHLFEVGQPIPALQLVSPTPTA